MKNLAHSRIITLFALLIISSVLLISCNKESREINNNITVDELVAQAAQQYLNIPVATGSEDEMFSLNNSGLPEVYLASSSGFDTKVTPNPLISCIKSVKLSEKQALEVRKALSIYEEQLQVFMKNQREKLATIEARFVAAKRELLKQAKNEKADREELEKRMIALKTKFEKAVRELKEKSVPNLSAPFKTLMTTLRTILEKRQWEAFIKCQSR
ncbi:MAG: hypothetical protein CVU12_08380 [Bacteroidetes bacterium HGW-Bacteroidetes-7]|jgi:hypothetical protein|nr:MAG: hypothetical protein CVU12_08380 [Bacteroidetes bacterium HGW-Bacteroidetes-7]